jgi:hypothetical protein
LLRIASEDCTPLGAICNRWLGARPEACTHALDLVIMQTKIAGNLCFLQVWQYKLDLLAEIVNNERRPDASRHARVECMPAELQATRTK